MNVGNSQQVLQQSTLLEDPELVAIEAQITQTLSRDRRVTIAASCVIMLAGTCLLTGLGLFSFCKQDRCQIAGEILAISGGILGAGVWGVVYCCSK